MKISEAIGTTKWYFWRATQLLRTHTCKITVAPEIKPMDRRKRVSFFSWFISQLKKLSERHMVRIQCEQIIS
jgi:ribosomal protein S18